MNEDEVAVLLTYVAETWPHYVLPTRREQLETRLLVWRDHLGDLDAGLVRAAIADCDDDHAPSPKQLREMALRLAGAPLPPDADVAVAEIQTAVRRLGWNGGPPEWSHPSIGDTVQAFGGWMELCESRNPEATRAHLLKLYATAAGRHRHRTSTSPIVAELTAALGLPALPSDDPAAIEAGPPTQSVSALRSPLMEPRDDEQHLRQLAEVRAAVDRAKRTDDGGDAGGDHEG